MPLVIKLAKERFFIELPVQSTPLSILRSLIADLIQLPPSSFKIIHSGALLKDDNAPISAYSLRQNSSITILPQHPTLLPKDSLPSPRSELSIISLIHAELASVRSALSPAVDLFLATPLESRHVQEKEHTRLGELLLQSLLRLDGISTEGDWEHARYERKAAVREVQALLDRLDGGWAEKQNNNL